jgi:glutamine---fructose-6-phosphate transaminase (isomerizing)
MSLRTEIRNAPRLLAETLEKARPEYEALVRRTRWDDGPVYMIGSGSSYFVALSGALAFEELLGLPVVVRRASDFTYSASLIRPRNVLLAISADGQSEDTLHAAREARARGATVLALTGDPASGLAEMADGVFLIRTDGGAESEITTMLCLQAAVGFLGLVTARVLKRHHQKMDELEQEFQNLPGQLDWALTKQLDAVRAFAAQMRSRAKVSLVGGGFYYPCSLLAAHLFASLTPIRADVCNVAELLEEKSMGREQESVVFLSGSRCRLKKAIHESARQAKNAGRKIFSLTDSNDRGLSDASTVALLLPVLHEMPASTLTLFVLEMLCWCISQDQGLAGSAK